MSHEEIKSGDTISPTTRVFKCANCGALSLSPNNICRIQGMVTKGDFCGTPSMEPPHQCVNKKHNHRYKCKKCNRVAVNREILCEPIKLEND
jgi:hypothetical protein